MEKKSMEKDKEEAAPAAAAGDMLEAPLPLPP
jgi:hypothetical protein